MEVNAQTSGGRAKQRIHLATVVWGGAYMGRFLRYSVPSLIAGLERSGLCRDHTCHFYIHTPETEIEAISTSPAVDDLRKLLPVEFCPAPIVPSEKLWTVSTCQVAATNRAYEDDAYIAFLVPDAIYSLELFGSISKAVNDSRSGLFVLGLRAVYESMAPDLDRLLVNDSRTLVVPSRHAVRMALEHLAPRERDLFWNSGRLAPALPHVYFSAGEDKIYAACWFLHPILIRPAAPFRRVRDVASGAYLERVIEDIEKVEIITDSDAGFFFKLSLGNEAGTSANRRPMTIGACIKWAVRKTDLLNRALFAQIICIHEHDMAPEVVDPHRQFASAIVSAILSEYDLRKEWRYEKLKRRWRIPAASGLLLIPLRVAHRAFGRVAYHASSRLFRPLANRLRRSTTFKRFAGDFVGRGVLAQGAFNLFLQWAARSAGRGASVPAQDTLIGRFLFDRGLALLDRGELEAAQELVRTSKLLSPHDERSFYSELINTLINFKKDAESRGENIGHRTQRFSGDPIVFAVVVWGQEYIDAFLDFTVRTLLAPGNIPALVGRTLVFSIVTDDQNRHRFEEHDTFRALEKYAQVEFFIFPSYLTSIGHYSSPNFNFYRLYGALDHTSIHFARALKGHIFFVVADALFARGAVPNILRYLERGYNVCVNASLVANKEEILPALEAAIGPAGDIDISSWDLANLCFRYRHDYTSQRLMSKSNISFDKYPREVYFPDREGLVVHALYQHPWAISASAISRKIELDYHIVDFQLVSRLFAHAPSFEKLKVIEDSAEVFIGNFAPQARRFETTGVPFSVKNFVAAHLHSQPIHWYIWKHRQLIRCDPMLPPEKNSEAVAASVLTALTKAVQG